MNISDNPRYRLIRERFVHALEARGEIMVTKGDKTWKMTRAKSGYYFLGAAGSLRIGPNKTASVPAADSFKQKLVEESKLMDEKEYHEKRLARAARLDKLPIL